MKKTPQPYLPKRTWIALLIGLNIGVTPLTALADEPLEEERAKRTVDLSTVVVTAAGFEQSVKEAPASMSVITNEALNTLPMEGLGSALQHIEGISIEQGGKAGGANIGIRGLPSDYTLLMIDGKRLSQNSSGARPNGFGDVDSNFIPPASAIERIEVVRGPMSTLYGSDALGGVINVITKKVPNEWGGEISTHTIIPFSSDYGNHFGSSLYLSGPIQKDRLGLALMGSFQHVGNAKGHYAKNAADQANGIESGRLSDFTGLGKKKNYNIGARLAFTPNQDNDILLNFDHGVQRFDNRLGQLGTPNHAVAPGKTGGGYADELRFDRTRLSLSHEGRYSFATIESSLLWDSTKTIGRLNPIKNPAGQWDGSKRDIKYDNLIFDHKWMFDWGDHFVTAGGQYKRQKLKDTLAEAPLDVKQWQWALFMEDEWMFTDNMVATFGLRYDRNELFGSHFSPRAYLLWEINDEWQLKGGISRAFRAPDINLMNDGLIGLGRQGTVPLLGNRDLQPETATSAEIALNFDNQTNFNAGATLFYTKFKDKIESVKVPNCQVNGASNCVDLGSSWDVPEFYKNMNVDDAKLYGLELTARYQVNDAFALSANYTYTDSRFRDGNGIKVPFSSTPRHMFNLKGDWQINERWNLWAQGEYRAKQFNDLNWNQEKVYYRSYLIANVGTSYKSSDQLTFSAGIYNLFDKNFADYSLPKTGSATPKPNVNYSNNYHRVHEGRRIWASLRYTF